MFQTEHTDARAMAVVPVKGYVLADWDKIIRAGSPRCLRGSPISVLPHF